MNKNLLAIGIILVTLSSSFAQNDYATITIYRPAKFKMCGVKAVVNIHGTDVAMVKNGGKLEYKLFTTGQTTLNVAGHNEFDKKTGLRLNTQRGKRRFNHQVQKLSGI